MSLIEFSKLHLKSLVAPPDDDKCVGSALARDEDKYAEQVVRAMSKLRD